jgi:cell division protein FtsW (lipid II flippase)
MSPVESSSSNPTQKYQGWVYIILVFLSVGGVALMDYSEKYWFWYWLAMGVIFGLVSVGMAWKNDQDLPGDQSGRVKKQALHWGTLILAILLVFLMHYANLFDRPSTPGLLVLLLLALTATLAGVHFNWRMAVVGLILMATFVAAVVAEGFLWILLLVGFVAVVVIFVTRRQSA